MRGLSPLLAPTTNPPSKPAFRACFAFQSSGSIVVRVHHSCVRAEVDPAGLRSFLDEKYFEFLRSMGASPAEVTTVAAAMVSPTATQLQLVRPVSSQGCIAPPPSPKHSTRSSPASCSPLQRMSPVSWGRLTQLALGRRATHCTQVSPVARSPDAAQSARFQFLAI